MYTVYIVGFCWAYTFSLIGFVINPIVLSVKGQYWSSFQGVGTTMKLHLGQWLTGDQPQTPCEHSRRRSTIQGFVLQLKNKPLP